MSDDLLAWQRRTMDEAERRIKADRRKGMWQSFAISAWIVIAIRFLGWGLGWWSC